MRVRIGLSMVAREVEVDAEDGDALAVEIEQAMAAGEPLVWVTDRDGVRHGLATDKIAFVELEAPGPRSGVGFSTR